MGKKDSEMKSFRVSSPRRDAGRSPVWEETRGQPVCNGNAVGSLSSGYSGSATGDIYSRQGNKE